MKRFYILTGVMVLAALAASSFAFNFGGSGGGGKRYNVTVSKLEAKGPAWSAAENYSSTTTRQHAVTYSGSTWIALANNINQTPSDGSTYWAKYIAQGPTGPTGAKGDTGSVTSSTGLDVAQRQYSSGYVKMLQPSGIGSNFVIITADDNITTSPKWKFGDSQITVNGTPYAGGGSSFRTVTRNVLTNMSSNNTAYFANGFAKHTLPLAAGNQSIKVFAHNSSAWVSAKTDSAVIKQYGGITSTAGYTIRIPKGGVYEFISNAADSVWYAIKQAGSDLTQYIADFVANLVWSPTSKDFGNVATDTEVYQKFTLTNTDNGSALNQTVSFLNQSSVFRLYSSTCAKAVFKPASSCTVGVAFKPTVGGTWGGTILKATADGLGDFTAALLGVGVAPDTTPSAFTFTDEIDVALTTAKVSNTITVAGINAAAAISVSGDTGSGYKKNGAACTSSSGTVILNDTVNACVTSSGSASTATAATVTIGGVSDTYTVTTAPGTCTAGDTGDWQAAGGSSVAIGDFAGDAQYASSFTATSTYMAYGIEFSMKRVNVPTGVNIRGKIYNNGSSQPGTLLVETVDTKDATSLGTTNSTFILQFDHSSPPTITSSVVYWTAIEAENFIGASAYISSNLENAATADRVRKPGTAGDSGITWGTTTTTDSLYFRIIKCQGQ